MGYPGYAGRRIRASIAETWRELVGTPLPSVQRAGYERDVAAARTVGRSELRGDVGRRSAADASAGRCL
jgi:hypothetical protein